MEDNQNLPSILFYVEKDRLTLPILSRFERSLLYYIEVATLFFVCHYP